MVLEIFEQADIDKLSFPILKLKENGPILEYDLEEKASELLKNG